MELPIKLTDEQYAELQPIRENGLGAQALMDRAAVLQGRADRELWDKIYEMFPDLRKSEGLRLHWGSREIIER